MRIRAVTVPEVQYVAYELAKRLMEWEEPIPAFESRYPNILESCVATPFQQFGGRTLYPGLIQKAAMLFYLLVKNHPFENGNKRIAIATLFFFLARNGKWLTVDNLSLYKFATSIAASNPRWQKRTVHKIQLFIQNHVVSLPNAVRTAFPLARPISSR